ncbi:MAG: pentapeptide repeat-containing protein [Symploca sp. SIO1C4]|uniref:Pentapeptide repeat-containing protein n=1 Tax=Symploca sp. SIO1C4 TaxID=2607765 RepID=A0A6B3NJ15_9CYAN|nr:pentapeptide repeat-containing protein [Symploca sp. SIO1C4]
MEVILFYIFFIILFLIIFNEVFNTDNLEKQLTFNNELTVNTRDPGQEAESNEHFDGFTKTSKTTTMAQTKNQEDSELEETVAQKPEITEAPEKMLTKPDSKREGVDKEEFIEPSLEETNKLYFLPHKKYSQLTFTDSSQTTSEKQESAEVTQIHSQKLETTQLSSTLSPQTEILEQFQTVEPTGNSTKSNATVEKITESSEGYKPSSEKLEDPEIAHKNNLTTQQQSRSLKTQNNHRLGSPKRITLWFLIELLILPFLIGLSVFFIQRRINTTQKEVATVKEHQEILENYINSIKDIELFQGLEDSLHKSEPGDQVRAIARGMTLTSLRSLQGDGQRKGRLVLFLHEAGLINANDPKIRLNTADLKSAKFPGFKLEEVNLSYADLRCTPPKKRNDSEKCADLSNAKMIAADLSGADLTAANLEGTNLRNAKLKYAYLKDVKINSQTNLHEKWKLIWQILNKTNDIKDKNLNNKDLSYANLREANLKQFTLENANLEKTDLEGANLEGANLRNANLEQAYLKDVKINSQTNLHEKWKLVWQVLNKTHEIKDKSLKNKNLSHANLTEANLKNFHLGRANLEGANLRGANLKDANLEGANLEGTNLCGAIMPDGSKSQQGCEVSFVLKEQGLPD